MQMAICPCDGFYFSLGATRAGGTRAIAPGYRVSCKGGFAGSESSARSRLLLVWQVPAWGAGARRSLADAGRILRSPVAFTLSSGSGLKRRCCPSLSHCAAPVRTRQKRGASRARGARETCLCASPSGADVNFYPVRETDS